MRPFWINGTAIGYKKITLLLFLMGVVVISNSFTPFSIVEKIAFGAPFITIILIFIWFAITRGVTIVREKVITNEGEYISVNDKIFISQPRKSIRIITHLRSGGIYSSIYLRKSKSWSYLDCIREIVVSNYPKPNSCLVLGGGGAVIPIGLLESFGIKSDVIEISPEMILLAKKYFLPLRQRSAKNKNRLRFIQGDAVQHLLHTRKKYGLIIVDLFHGLSPLSEIHAEKFIRKLRTTGQLVCVNFGPDKNNDSLHLFTQAYMKALPRGHIYTSKGNILGVFSSKKTLKTIKQQRIF